MTPPPWTACKFYFKGRCCYGPKCKYRHNIPGVMVKQQVSLVEEPSSLTMPVLVDGHIETAFGAGVVPVKVDNLYYSDRGLQLERIETSININWVHRPRETLLQYRSAQIAQKACQKLNNMEIDAAKIQARILGRSRGGGKFTIKITGMPNWLTAQIILNRLEPYMGTEKGSLPYTELPLANPGHDAISDFVTRITAKHPIAVHDVELKDSEQHLKHQVKVQFNGCPRLDRAAKELNGQSMPELDHLKLRAWETVTVHLKLKATTYLRLKGRLKSCANEYTKHKVVTHIDEENGMQRDHINIRMSSASREGLTEAKRALERIIMEGLVQNPKPLKQTHGIRLTRKTNFVEAVSNGGIEKAQKLLGKDVVYLDSRSDPPAAIVQGDVVTLRKAQRCIYGEQFVCAICFEPSCNIIKVEGCNHIACEDDFDQYCTTEGDSKFPLRCFQTDCHNLISMEQIRRQLRRESFNRLVSQSIENYFRRHPEQYIKCSGPDCPSYLPVEAGVGEGTEHVCPECFTSNCTSCKVEYHFGETCEAYQDRTQQNDIRLMLAEEGAKTCPSCQYPFTKIKGTCNNAECGVCKQCFCWICLKTFDDHNKVYDHLKAEHGGFYDNARQADRAQERLLRHYRARGGWEDEPAGAGVRRPRVPPQVAPLQQHEEERIEAIIQRLDRDPRLQIARADRELARELQEQFWLEDGPV